MNLKFGRRYRSSYPIEVAKFSTICILCDSMFIILNDYFSNIFSISISLFNSYMVPMMPSLCMCRSNYKAWGFTELILSMTMNFRY